MPLSANLSVITMLRQFQNPGSMLIARFEFPYDLQIVRKV
jgi:hypothetical protein